MKIPQAAARKARRLKEGKAVGILWLDSGRNSTTRATKLATRWVYGRVAGIEDDTICLAMDVCTGQDEHDDSGNQWGFVWIPSIIKVVELEPK